MLQAFVKLGLLFIILVAIVFIFLHFLGFLLPVAALVGGVLIFSIVVFAIIFALLAVLLAIYYAITKKPEIERSRNWKLERIKGKGEE